MNREIDKIKFRYHKMLMRLTKDSVFCVECGSYFGSMEKK